MTHQPDCFILMPFGRKPDPNGGGLIDFDHIYEAAILPGVEAAGFLPLRADFEKLGGIIHRPMFERLLLCDFAVADLTTANPNVFYELGIRHAVRPATTLTVAADEKALPFDVQYLRTLPYRLNANNRFSAKSAQSYADEIRDWLLSARARQLGDEHGDHSLEDMVDSPLFQLLGDYKPPDLTHLKTDAFAHRLSRVRKINADIAAVRASARLGGADGLASALDRLDSIREELGDLREVEAGASIDLMLGYRAISAWGRMVDVYQALPRALQRQTLPCEQFAFALNRQAEEAAASGRDGAAFDAAGLRDRALRVLTEVEARNGPNPETSGLIGRIHKTCWLNARRAGDPAAPGHLNKAISAYRRGFQADWRDFYPGVNLVTLLHASGTSDALVELTEVLPVVRYSVLRRFSQEADDYWKHATLLELAVLAGQEAEAWDHLMNALASVSEDFQTRTTASNLQIIQSTGDLDRNFVSGLVDALEKPFA